MTHRMPTSEDVFNHYMQMPDYSSGLRVYGMHRLSTFVEIATD